MAIKRGQKKGGGGREGASGSSATNIKCPACGTPTVYNNANPNRPFCSRHCKLNDLAAWASDEYRVPASAPLEGDREEEQNYRKSPDQDHSLAMNPDYEDRD